MACCVISEDLKKIIKGFENLTLHTSGVFFFLNITRKGDIQREHTIFA